MLLKAMSKKITWWDAAEIIGVTDRTMRRWRARLEEDGYSGLLDWSQGIWQEVSALQKLRVEFAHQGISHQHRFAEASQADKAVEVCREAINVFYRA